MTKNAHTLSGSYALLRGIANEKLENWYISERFIRT